MRVVLAHALERLARLRATLTRLANIHGALLRIRRLWRRIYDTHSEDVLQNGVQRPGWAMLVSWMTGRAEGDVSVAQRRIGRVNAAIGDTLGTVHTITGPPLDFRQNY
jgi:hypothetical protein